MFFADFFPRVGGFLLDMFHLRFRFVGWLASLVLVVGVGNVGLRAQSNGLLLEVYENIVGTAVRDLIAHESFPGRPTSESIIESFETPTDVAEQYGQKVSGYVLPPQTGDYVFWIASDDGGALFLSTDETPSKIREIASVPGWTSSRQWTKYDDQKSDPIRLVSGRRYYVEALMKEQGGGDNLAVRWQLPDGRIEEPIPSQRLQPTSLGPPDIIAQPKNTSVVEGESVEFAVELSRQIGASYQWQRNGTNIPGATLSVLELENLAISDSGGSYRVVVTNGSGTVTSNAARLTVLGDQSGPALVSVLNLGSATSLTVTFSEPVNVNSGGNPSNYVIDQGVSVIEATVTGDGETVVIETGPLVPGTQYRLSVSNVADRASAPNVISADSSMTFAWDFEPLPLGDLVGAPEPVGPAARTSGIVISEIHYHPQARDDDRNLEFIELYNSQLWEEDLSGHRLSGAIDFEFPDGTLIEAESYLIIAVSPEDVEAHYGVRGVLGPIGDSLPNDEGLIRLRNRAEAILLEVRYKDRHAWPVAADGFGHSLVLARPSYGQGNVEAWFSSQAIDGSPGKVDPPASRLFQGVLINEVLAHTDDPVLDFIELYNYSDQDVNLSGCHLSDDPDEHRYTFPEGTVIPARGFVALDQVQLGFALSSKGEAIALRAPNGGRVIDALRFSGQENGVSLGRYPDGATRWSSLSDQTLGTPNSNERTPRIVINEIMYHPISEESDDEFIELFNASDDAVDISGWRLNDEISFRIPENTVISAGQYAVIAKNAARLVANYGNLELANTLGDYSGTLSNNGGRIALERPDTIEVITESGDVEIDQIWILEDEVDYHDGGRWGQWSDGGGSSLELVDAHSDNRFASNWADSDETSKGAWSSIEFTGRLDNGRGAFNELQILLLGRGECLIDDLFAGPVGGANRVPNATFENGLDGWVIQGNHVRSTLSAPERGYESDRSLHLRATSGGDNGANRVETDLSSAFSNGQRATLRAQVRWLRGHPEVLLRLHGNPIELSVRLSVPGNLGSPGLGNSQARTNQGPAIVGVSHAPILPRTGQAVEVTAQVSDPDGLSNLVLKFRTDREEEYRSVPMTYRGAGAYSAMIPGQANRTMVAFFVEASDGHEQSASSQFPSSPFNRECLVRFGESNIQSDFGTYRVWIANDNLNTWRRREKLSNELIDTTFVYGNYRAIYNTLSRFRGSPFIRPGYGNPASSQPTAMIVVFPEDDLFLDTTKINMDGLEQPGRDNTLQRERASFWIAKQMDLPFSHQRYVQFVVNGIQKGEIFADSQHPSSEYVSTWFPNEDEGDLYKIDDWFEFNDSVLREFNENARLRRYVSEGELKVARYRWSWEKKPNQGYVDDYSSLLELVNALNSGNSVYEQSVESLVDIDQWMRIFAVRHIVGDWDGYGYNRGKNMSTYKPKDGKWKMILWDLDFSLGGGSDGPTTSMFSTSDTTVSRLYSHPSFRRAYLRAWQDAIDGPLLESQIGPVLDDVYSAFRANSVTAGSPGSIKSWIRSRRSYLVRELGRENADFEITTNSGNGFESANNVVSLQGKAPVAVKTILVNGVEYPIEWTSVQDFRIQAPLVDRVTNLRVEGFDLRGELVGGSQDSIQVTYTGESQDPAEHLVISEIMYNPAIPGAGFVEIQNTSSTHSFDLSGYVLNGVDYRFDQGFVLGPLGFATVVSDRSSFSEVYGGSVPVTGEFKGRLANDGETISLVDRSVEGQEGIVIDEVTYADQSPWPALADGQGSSLQLVDVTADNRRVANWEAVAPTGEVRGPQALISMTSTWRYNQDGTNLGTAWRSPSYNDSRWDSGRGLLFVESSGLPEAKNTALTLGEPTYYFRTTFDLDDIAGIELNASLIIDDGAVVYLNGTEVLRVRIPNGNVTFNTFASGTVTNAELEGPFALPSGALVAGENVIAVEVHQTNATSSDIVFGLSLIGESRGGGVASTPGMINSVARQASELPQLWLNEVQPVNQTTLQDGQGEFDPWIELHNSSDAAISLANLSLSTDYLNPAAWTFPEGATIGAGDYVIVWGDGEPNESSADEWHTNFRMDPEMGSMLLSQSGATGFEIVDYLNIGEIRADRSFGALPNGSPNRRQPFFLATPGEANTSSIPIVSVTINEWMANNVGTIENPLGGGFDDWFELYNAADAPVDLSGYFLSDNIGNLDLFEIPDGTVIGARSFLVVWAGGDATDRLEQGALHVGFRLNSGGEVLTLSGPDGALVDQVAFLAQLEDVSQGRLPDGNLSRIGVLSVASPGSANAVGAGPNLPPIVLPLPALVADEGDLVNLTVGAFDPDGGLLRFELGPKSPIGSRIDPSTGEITWLTGEIHGPGQFVFPVVVTDSGDPAMSATVNYSVRVNEINQAPFLGNVADQTVSAGGTLTVRIPGADEDLPLQSLRFVLGAGSPSDATIDPVSGELSWSPSIDQEPGLYQFTVMVTDDGVPALSSAVGTFGVTVTEPTQDVEIVLVPSGGSELVFEWDSSVGSRYSIETLEDLVTGQWVALGTLEGTGTVLQFRDPIPASGPTEGQRFYRVVRLNP